MNEDIITLDKGESNSEAKETGSSTNEAKPITLGELEWRSPSL